MSAPVAPDVVQNNAAANNDALNSNRSRPMSSFERGESSFNLVRQSTSASNEADELYTAIEKLVTKLEAHKTIGFAGSISLIVNNCTGGGMVLFAAIFQQNGWLLTTLVMALVLGLVIVCGLLMIEVQAMIPGNGRFQRRLEFTTILQYYTPGKWYLFWQAVLQLYLFFNNVALIIQSVQVTDTVVQAIAGRSCVVPLISPSFGFACPDPPPTLGQPFPDGSDDRAAYTYFISLGWWLTAAVLIPMSTVDLEDNIIVQDGAVLATAIILISWVAMFIGLGLDGSRLPAIGPLPSAQLIGVVLFNFSITYSLPSWANEKQASVNIVKTFAISGGIVTLMYMTLGVFGALAFDPFWNGSDTLLSLIYSNINSRVAKITYYMFPTVVNLSSVPVNAVYMRYNMLELGIMSRRTAIILSAAGPWLVAIPFYTGSGFQLVVTWTGIVLSTPLNFVLPPILYLIAVRWQESGRPWPPVLATTLAEREKVAHEAKKQVERVAEKLGVRLAEVVKLKPVGSNADMGAASVDVANSSGGVVGEGSGAPTSPSSPNTTMSDQNSPMSQQSAEDALDRLLRLQQQTSSNLNLTFFGKKDKGDAQERSESTRLLLTKPKKPPTPAPPPRSPLEQYSECNSVLSLLFFFFTLPARALFYYTIPHAGMVTRWYPNDRQAPTKWSPVACLMSTVYVAGFSFIIVWMSARVAEHFAISYFLTGATLIATAVVLPALPLSHVHTQSKRAAKYSLSLSQDISSNLLSLGVPLFLYTICVYTGSDVEIHYGAIELAFLLKFLLVSLTIIYVQSEQWVLTPSVVPVCLFILVIYYLTLFLVEWTALKNMFAVEETTATSC